MIKSFFISNIAHRCLLTAAMGLVFSYFAMADTANVDSQNRYRKSQKNCLTFFVLDGQKLIPLIPKTSGKFISIDRVDRSHNFTFTSCTTNVPFFAGKGGGAEVLAQELITRMEQTSNQCVLVGHSLGGLFALEFRRRYPHIPCSIMAFDPSLWWDPSIDWRNIKENNLFVAFGTKKQKSPLSEKSKPAVKRFVELHPNVVELYPSATHATIFASAITNALRRISR